MNASPTPTARYLEGLEKGAETFASSFAKFGGLVLDERPHMLEHFTNDNRANLDRASLAYSVGFLRAYYRARRARLASPEPVRCYGEGCDVVVGPGLGMCEPCLLAAPRRGMFGEVLA